MLTPEEELALAALRAAEWMGKSRGWPACPLCHRHLDEGHGPACQYRKALDALEVKKVAGSSTVAVNLIFASRTIP